MSQHGGVAIEAPSPYPLPLGEGQDECALSLWERIGVRKKMQGFKKFIL
jgi:hypothetical protein